MNKEEIDEIDKLEIDFNNVDELNLVLEVSSKKTIYLIDDLTKSLLKLQQENQQLKLELLEKKCSDKDVEYKEKIKLQQRIDKAINILGQYKHYSVPEEKQNSENEELVNDAYDILKGEK